MCSKKFNPVLKGNSVGGKFVIDLSANPKAINVKHDGTVDVTFINQFVKDANISSHKTAYKSFQTDKDTFIKLQIASMTSNLNRVKMLDIIINEFIVSLKHSDIVETTIDNKYKTSNISWSSYESLLDNLEIYNIKFKRIVGVITYAIRWYYDTHIDTDSSTTKSIIKAVELSHVK